MNAMDVFTTKEESQLLIRCGVDGSTASFISVRNAPSNSYCQPTLASDMEIIKSACKADPSLVIPIWCLNDLLELVPDGFDYSSLHGVSRRDRVSNVVSVICKAQ